MDEHETDDKLLITIFAYSRCDKILCKTCSELLNAMPEFRYLTDALINARNELSAAIDKSNKSELTIEKFVKEYSGQKKL